MKFKVLSLVMLLICGGNLFAEDQIVLEQNNANVDYSPLLKTKPVFKPEHNVRFTLGGAPMTMLFADMKIYTGEYNMQNPGYAYDRGLYYTTESFIPLSYNLSYTYKPLRWLEVGATIGYAGYFKKVRSVIDDKLLGDNSIQFLTVAPVLRFSWLNKEYFRMYSSISLGFGVAFYNDYDYGQRLSEIPEYMFPSVQLTYLGMTFGKKLYGSVELISIGTEGLFNAGIGYRF